MNEPSSITAVAPPASPEKLALAQQAFARFHARCFWFMREDAQITPAEIPYLCHRLRTDGGREGFFWRPKYANSPV